MAQTPYRGNLSSKVFPFLSSQFGQSVIIPGVDQVITAQYSGEAAGADINVPQAYYMHNVVPTAQGYKSVGFRSIVPPNKIKFDKIIPVRDPDMSRGWIATTASGQLFIYRAGDFAWSVLSSSAQGWNGGEISVANANGTTYVCIANFGVYRLSVTNKTLTDVTFVGLQTSGIVAITSASGYMIVTDGVTVYWSSTISPEDFTPSLITGAGSGKPSDLEGLAVALVPTSNGFAVYSSVNVVVAIYSQNARFPWIFKGAANSKGIVGSKHIASSGEDGNTYAWTSAGMQRINAVGAVTIMGEVTDFLAGNEIEDFDSVTNTLSSHYTSAEIKVKLAFVGARYLVISYGETEYTHALIYDTALKRWGKLKFTHVACFEVALNTDGVPTTSNSATAKNTLGLVTLTGEVVVCNFDDNAEADDSVIILGKFQLTRTRLITLDSVSLESIDEDATVDVTVLSTLDGKNPLTPVRLTARNTNGKYRQYMARITGLNHSLVVKGKFFLNSFELAMHINGRR